MKLVGVDPFTTIVRRLFSSDQKATGCRCENNEKLSIFVSCFRSLAAKHLPRSQESSFSQIGEVLTSNILNHAILEEGVLTDANIQVIAHTESRVGNKE